MSCIGAGMSHLQTPCYMCDSRALHQVQKKMASLWEQQSFCQRLYCQDASFLQVFFLCHHLTKYFSPKRIKHMPCAPNALWHHRSSLQDRQNFTQNPLPGVFRISCIEQTDWGMENSLKPWLTILDSAHAEDCSRRDNTAIYKYVYIGFRFYLKTLHKPYSLNCINPIP